MNAHDLAEKHGMLSGDEVDLLQECAMLLPSDPVIINMGAGVGTSAVAFLEIRPDCFIFSIDRKIVPAEADAINEANLDASRCLRVLTNTGHAGKNWPFRVDLIFGDAAHHLDGVREEVSRWRPRMKNNGIYIFHDYGHPNIPGLKELIDDLMSDCNVLGTARYMIAFEVD